MADSIQEHFTSPEWSMCGVLSIPTSALNGPSPLRAWNSWLGPQRHMDTISPALDGVSFTLI